MFAMFVGNLIKIRSGTLIWCLSPWTSEDTSIGSYVGWTLSKLWPPNINEVSVNFFFEFPIATTLTKTENGGCAHFHTRSWKPSYSLEYEYFMLVYLHMEPDVLVHFCAIFYWVPLPWLAENKVHLMWPMEGLSDVLYQSDRSDVNCIVFPGSYDLMYPDYVLLS